MNNYSYNSHPQKSKADLVGEFKKIDLPNSIDFGDDGAVKITVTNRGDDVAQGPVNIKLYISTDDNLNSNDELLTSVVRNINLKPGKSRTFNLKYDNLTSAIAPGSYNLIAQIDADNTIGESREKNNIISQAVSAAGTDVVIDWNATALNAIQAEGEAGRGVPPTQGSRMLAMVSAAVYDTVNAFVGTHTPYAIDADAPAGASIEAAVAGAAHRMLVTFLPQQTQLFNQQLDRTIQELSSSRSSNIAGLSLGRSITDQILELRANDGWDDDSPYSPPEGDYVWYPATEGSTAGVVLGPNWGKVKPFAIESVEDFSPDGIDGLPGTQQYAREIEEVRTLGGKESTDLTTITRTADQTEIAHFWAYDRDDTFRPYGQLNQIAQEVAVREGNSLAENARLFGQLNIALADAAIVAWDTKYDYVQPRPDYIIADGFADIDGMDATTTDPDWDPLLNPNPPFPDYISGHSSFAGAFAGVMTNFFGEDYEFTAVSQELPGVTRHYDSFYDAAYDDAVSRVYGGIHVREATVTDALPMGVAVGNYVAENLLTPLSDSSQIV
ncbi:MAG: CARDB domain-containing protein [Geitlerinemataceae cyanobacterium]